jgi:hypothetical protein
MRAPVRFALGAIAVGVAASLAAPASASTCRVDVNADVTTSVAAVHSSTWYDAGIHDGTVGESETTVDALGLPQFHAGDTTTQSPGQGVVEALTGIWVPGLVCS